MMPSLTNRQSIWKRDWDYAAAGRDFVAINTHVGRPLFGAATHRGML